MRLRTQLVVSFFLLAVVPLGAITLYSYIASIRALHRAVQSEAARMAQEMEHRMSVVTAGLSRRLDLFEKIPFPEGQAGRLVSGNPLDARLVGRLLATLGDAAGLIDALEFTPASSPSGAPPLETGAPGAAPPPHAAPGRRSAERPGPPVVIRLPSLAHAMRENPDLAAAMENLTGLLPSKTGPVTGTIVEGVRKEIEQQLGQVASEIAEAMRRESEKHQPGRGAAAQPPQARVETAQQAQAARPELPSINLKTEFGCQIPGHGGSLGHLRARVSTDRLLTDILSQTRREQGEIPFAMDGDGNLFTLDPADLPKLRTLARLATSRETAAVMPAGSQDASGRAGRETPGAAPADGAARVAPDGHVSVEAAGINDEWVVVARDDPDSGLSFGIARPIGASLVEMRKTAGRNLAAGLAIAALALFGIVPISRRMTHNLSDLTRGAEQLAAGRLDTQVPVRSRDELGQLARAFNRMARELSAGQERRVEQERIRKELEMCRKIQNEFLPKAPLAHPFAEVQGVAIPARELGGDFFNYFPLPGGEVALLVGDVSGKGVPAALLMANLQATLRARLPLERDLARFADRLDGEVESSTPAAVYLTLFLATLDPLRRELRYVNAGHESPFLLRSTGALERLEPTGRPIGLMAGGGYVERRVPVEAGDRLFLYTDGLVDAENAAGDAFGPGRLESLLARESAADAPDRPATGPSGPQALLAKVERAYLEHRGSTEAADDATLLILRVGDRLRQSPHAGEPLQDRILPGPPSSPAIQV